MANNKLSVLKFLEQSYDIDALFLGGVAADKFARRDTDNSFTGENTFSAGVKISGRLLGAGDDEGLVIGRAENSYAGVCLGEPAGIRSVFYLKPDNSAIWRYNNGTSNFDIFHPAKAGTIALTSDVPTKVSQLTNDSGYGTVAKVDNISPTSGNVSLSAVRFVSQTLTDAQKTQVRTNIGAASSTHTHKDSEVLLYTNSQATTPYATLQEWTSAMNSISSLVSDYLGNTMFQPHDHSAYNIALLDDEDIPYIDLQSFHNQVKNFMASSGGGGGGGSSSAYTTLDRDFYLDSSYTSSATFGYFRYADNDEVIPSSDSYDDVSWEDCAYFGWLMEWFRRDVFQIPPVVYNSTPEEGSDIKQIAARGRCLFPSDKYWREPSLPLMVLGNVFPGDQTSWDSMVVECLGGPGSDAECTMTIDLYTRTAEHYRLQVASTAPGATSHGEYITKGVQRIDNKVGSSDETITDIKVVSSLPSNPDPKTLYIIV